MCESAAVCATTESALGIKGLEVYSVNRVTVRYLAPQGKTVCKALLTSFLGICDAIMS